jgi:alpha-D-ribose 1-methylphosphonate 5-triphosphate synthase subunit PhnH
LLIQLPSLGGGPSLSWRGPGIESENRVALPLASGFWLEREAHNDFPRGLDVFFLAGNDLLGLPRSTRVAQIVQERA